jgi:hypothetical protein
MRYIIQAFLALGALIAAPLLLDTPDELWEQIAAGVAVLILVGLAFRGVVGFVHSRKPKAYHDSIMVPKDPPKPSA